MAGLQIAATGEPARGEHRLDGGKHAFAHTLACAALADSARLMHVPRLVDSGALIEALGNVFERVRYDAEQHSLHLDRPRAAGAVRLSSQLLTRSRNLFCLLPALLHRASSVVLEADPKGCDIGARPHAWYVETLTRFGVEASEQREGLVLRWRDRRPADVAFEYPTMTGTVVAIAAASVVPGPSTLRNASVEPSCEDQLACAAAMGVTIDGALPSLRIEGRSTLSPPHVELSSDRVHAATLACAALLTRGELTLRSSAPLRVPRLIEFLHTIGARVREDDHTLFVGFPHEGRLLGAARVEAGSEPLFSSDWVPFAALLLATRSQGTSVLSDDVFLKRFQFKDCLPEGASIGVSTTLGQRGARAAVFACVDGDPNASLPGGRTRPCPDIRGSAALALSALVSRAPIFLDDDFQIRRGYENLGADLERLGVAKVTRVS